MEAAPGVSTAGRNGGVSLPAMSLSSSFSPQPSRKEWRVVSEQSARNSGNEEMERPKLVQSDERLIYEVVLDNDILQQRLHAVAKQREELQNMEIELRADVIARSEIVGLRNTFDARIKEHANVTVKLQEQLHEKEQKMHELGRRMDEKERELHAIRLDNEAAWAKENLLTEQIKELQSYRRDRDNSEAEIAQHIKQIHDLQEHIQDKERQFIELQEQQRIAQETIIFKDEQIREAQVWITRAQEMDVLHSTTNHTLQAELRDRTEQYNQLWLGCQSQFGEMERLHMHIQQLQHEIADAREKSGSHSDEAHVIHTNNDDASRLGHVNGSQLEVNDNNSPGAITGSPQNDNPETSGGNALAQNDHVQGVSFAPPSLFGIPTYLPTALHPFVLHQQGVLHPSHVTQSHFQSIPAMSSVQNWQNQQALPEGEHMSRHNQYSEQTEENLLKTDIHYDYEALVNGQVRTNYSDAKVSPVDVDAVVPPPNGNGQVLYSIGESNGNAHSQHNLQEISSQFHDALRLDLLEHGNDTKEKNDNRAIDHGLENKTTSMENSSFATNGSSSEVQIQAVNFSGTVLGAVSTNTSVSTGQKSDLVGKPVESYLLDERALLASIARTIGSSGKIRISSTLANRLGKMIAPLHWHDYKKKYGKLDDFVASHPDLFLIEGDYIQLRGGAQQIIAATTAVAKVAAAAAAAPSSYSSSSMPSVAMTPMAQSHRFKKVSSLESSSADADKASFNQVAVGNGTSSNGVDFSQINGTSHHGRPGSNLVGKQQSRSIGGAAPSSRR